MRTTTFARYLAAWLISLALCTAVWAEPTRIPLNPIKALAVPRTLVGESRTRLPSGAVVRQYLWEWKDPRKLPAGTRQMKLGRVQVMRNYTPVEDGTRVEQVVLVKPGRPTAVRGLTDQARLAGASLQLVMGLANERYVEPVDPTKLLRDAARGVTLGLDRHTTYFDPEQFKRFTEDMRGSVQGIGVAIRGKQDKVTIQSARPGSPARRAGLRPGDQVLSVNGAPVKNVVEVTDQIRGGEAGTPVTLGVSRGGQPLEFTITRQPIQLAPVRSRLTKDGIGYVRLSHFDEGSSDRVGQVITALEQRNHGPLKGLVLDLRKNPGGGLSEATALVNRFVPQGTLVTTRGRGDQVHETFVADPAKLTHGNLPLTVLIDKGSASASELVSGALKDLGRATILGEKSYGKGSVQHIFQLPDGAGIKMTMERYYLPGGQTPDKVGISPDVTREQARAAYLARQPRERAGQPKIVDYVYEEALSVLRGRNLPALRGETALVPLPSAR